MDSQTRTIDGKQYLLRGWYPDAEEAERSRERLLGSGRQAMVTEMDMGIEIIGQCQTQYQKRYQVWATRMEKR